MVELITFIIFSISVFGIGFIVVRKMPVLAGLPQNGHHGFKKPALMIKVEKKIKEHHFYLFKKQMWLHRLLSFAKVWILKIETKIDYLLHGIRKKAQELDKETKKKK